MTARTTPQTRTPRRASMTLRGLTALAFTVALAGAATPAQTAPDAADEIAEHFSSVRTMKGEFVQFGPSGEQTGGTFNIERPGRILFNYEEPSGYHVVSDGESVVIHNEKMRTADLYPLSRTPLKLLLQETIDLSDNKVTSVKEDDDLTTIELADRSVFGNSTITMMFDAESHDLRQWTITDAQGKDTTVMIFNIEEGVSFEPDVFEIDYRRVNEMNTIQTGR